MTIEIPEKDLKLILDFINEQVEEASVKFWKIIQRLEKTWKEYAELERQSEK